MMQVIGYWRQTKMWSYCFLICVWVLSCFSHVWLFVTLWTIYSPPGSSVHGILPCRPAGDLPDQGSKLHLLRLLHCGQFFTSEPSGKPFWCVDTAFWKADTVRAMFPYGNRESDFAPRRGISLFKDHLDIGFNISWAGDFPGGPVVKTTHFQCRGQVFNPWSGNLVAWTKENKQKSKKKKINCWAVWTCRCSRTSLDFSCHQYMMVVLLVSRGAERHGRDMEMDEPSGYLSPLLVRSCWGRSRKK